MVELAALALSIALAAQAPAGDVALDAQQPAADAVSQQLATDPAAAAIADPTLVEPAAEASPVQAEEPAAGAGPVGAAAGENPYGLSALWNQGDLMILVIMSLSSWYIIVTKLWDQSRLRRQLVQTEKSFWAGRTLQDGIATLTDKDNVCRVIAEQGIKAAQHHEGRLTDQIPLHEWITQSLQRSVEKVVNDLQGGLSFLATAGSTAPFVGLFGTVWGIYHALISIGIAGQASIDKVAGPVGEALIMTAIGLAVAVPAVLGYNWLLRRNKALLEEVRYFATDVQAYLISGARVESGSGLGAASVAQRSK